jgi:hypothetical protein
MPLYNDSNGFFLEGDLMMNSLTCPHCGASLVKDTPVCDGCENSLDWLDGQPVVVSTGSALRRVAIVTLIAVIAAALVLTAVLWVLVRA